MLETKAEKNGYFAKVIDEARKMAVKEGVTLHTKVVAGHEVETIVDYVVDRLQCDSERNTSCEDRSMVPP